MYVVYIEMVTVGIKCRSSSNSCGGNTTSVLVERLFNLEVILNSSLKKEIVCDSRVA